MDISRVAQNLYKKHLGRYLIYQLENRRVKFRHLGRCGTCRITKVRRDVFENKIQLVSATGKAFTFREPSYITNEDGKIVFVYLDTSNTTPEDGTPAEIGSRIEFSFADKDEGKAIPDKATAT